MYKYIFGPVYSKRFGLSLGIDLLGEKICSMNCPYCEITKTQKLTVGRDAYVSARDVIKELSEYLENKNVAFEYITFSGKGEPLLNTEISLVINYLKQHYPYKIAILTNGSHLNDKSVRDEIQDVDLIMPSLDAISSRAFKKVNIPHPSLSVEKILDGIMALKEEFQGEIWIEILFVKGVNDTDEEIALLKKHIGMIQPQRVYVNTVYRPPAFSNVSPILSERCLQLQEEFDQLLFSLQESVVGSVAKYSPALNDSELRERLEMILQVRPSTYDDLQKIFCVYGNVDLHRFRRLFESFLKEKGLRIQDFCSERYYIIPYVDAKEVQV